MSIDRGTTRDDEHALKERADALVAYARLLEQHNALALPRHVRESLEESARAFYL